VATEARGARFDDLRHGTAWQFPPPAEIIAAHRLDDVEAVIERVEQRTADGAWAFGFVAYEAAPAFDDHLVAHPRIPDLPLAWFGVTGEPWQVAPVARPSGRRYEVGRWRPVWDAERHARAVAAVRDRIAAGETYQCNLTTRLITALRGELADFYTDLALAQGGGAYNAYLDTGRFVIASASPELFFEIADREITVRPMKGTTARGRTADEDARRLAALRASEKERAENVMIVDLVRNDLARVASTGTVTVSSLCEPERYDTVHQLVSEVRAELAPEVRLVDVFRALFPCGSVTGAPKPRTMQLIAALEDSPRGVYCGAVGFVGPTRAHPSTRFSVAIRTVVADRVTGSAGYGAGGGITWASDATDEYAELLAKAELLAFPPHEFHLIETMRHERGTGVRSLVEHLRRITASAAYFDFAFDTDSARATIAGRLAGVDDALVRLRAFRDGTLTVEVEPLPAPPLSPLRLAVDPEPVDSRRCWPHHKTSLREPYDSRRSRHPEADEVLLVNERGELTEASTANVAVHLDGRWWTPPAGDGCLPGIERGRLVRDGVLAERVLRPADLQRADHLALVNSLRGWRAAVLLTSSTARLHLG
jgi:para-aminobenzoate synthetase/4-amino-4-deoxychorismate lyase